MQKLVINGRNKLSGEIDIQGAKNAALPILAAAALCKGEVVLRNCPRLSDVFSAMRILTYLGANTSFEDRNTVRVCTDGLSLSEIPDNLMREMRSSIFFLLSEEQANAGSHSPEAATSGSVLSIYISVR